MLHCRASIGTVAAMAFAMCLIAMFPVVAHAQVNIDQGKSAAEIYNGVCTACHKTPRGLAVGKNAATLSSFLSEHYTASRVQAAALAAYVLSSGGAEAAPKTASKPEAEHARAEEPKIAPRATSHPVRADAKPGEVGHPRETAKREQAPSPKDEVKREEHPRPTGAEKPEVQPETANREEHRAPEETPPSTHDVAPVATAPVSAPAHTAEAPNPNPAPASTPKPAQAAAPMPSEAKSTVTSAAPSLELGSALNAVPPKPQQSAGPPAPRDRIPD